MMTQKWRDLAFQCISRKNRFVIFSNSHAGRVTIRANTPKRASISNPVAPTIFFSGRENNRPQLHFLEMSFFSAGSKEIKTSRGLKLRPQLVC
jgi:hypothetical protein